MPRRPPPPPPCRAPALARWLRCRRADAITAGLLALAVVAAARAAVPDYNRDVRPILSENCFQCHGQDPAKREAELRLDRRAEAIEVRDGIAAIVPGRPAESELLRRLTSREPSEQMPPPESHKRVTAAEAEVLRRWIEGGAPYAEHWAFVPPVRPTLPAQAGAGGNGWGAAGETLHPVDALVRARLAAEGLAPAPPAAPETWLRRASFDLVGLPPTLAEIDAFAADVGRRGDAAYRAAADRLLASPHYGERQALEWLDVARYADSHGFNNDSARVMWRWRDWVIDAFNANLRYDRFITEQLAGDLLPEPTLEQRLATGFGRNHVINSEGGIIDEEYRVEYVADRVRTLSTAWLGLTFECARCHDHKFDPISQRDYYRLFAFFNNVPEHGEDGRVANAIPMIPAPTRMQQEDMAAQQAELARLDAAFAAAAAAIDPEANPAVERTAALLAAARMARAVDPVLAAGVALTDHATPPSDSVAPTVPGERLDFGAKAGASVAFWLQPDPACGRDVPLLSALNHRGNPADSQFGKGREIRLIDGEIEIRFSDRFPVYATVVRSEGARIGPGRWRHVAVSYAGGKKAASLRLFVDGEELPLAVRYDGQQAEPPRRDFLLGADNLPAGPRFIGRFRHVRGFAAPLDLAAVRLDYLADADGLWDPQARRAVLAADAAESRAAAAQRTGLRERHLALRRSLPTAMVMSELPEPRPAHVLRRGAYDAPGESVTAGLPDALSTPWPDDAPRNRLGLARWLTQPGHPLTGRVVVNRLWAQLFGTGLVKTLEDFGAQGEWPSHPELLDWLARELVDSGWDMKALLRQLVLTQTYRQSSDVSPALLARDPENRLLARGLRIRLPAELIRDQALAAAGLLVPRIGGPSVFPYQPEKLYDGIVVGADYPGTKWSAGTGEDLYRRSLYTFWKRTVPHPAMVAFDAPDREFCTVRRSRTNTPLQALVLWNEPGQVEAARHLGTRMLREGGADDAGRATLGFRLVTGRRPTAAELAVLTATWGRLRADFQHAPEDAAAFLRVGATPPDAAWPASELAAAAGLGGVLLGLDETLTKN